MSQDDSQNGAKLAILGAKLAIIAPFWRQVGHHSAILPPSWRHLAPSWLHFGLLLGTTCSPKCSQGAQDATRTPKTTFRAPIFKDLGIIVTADLQRICGYSLVLYLFIYLPIYLVTYLADTDKHIHTNAHTHTHIHTQKHHRNTYTDTDTNTKTQTRTQTRTRTRTRHPQPHTDTRRDTHIQTCFAQTPSTRKNQQKWWRVGRF